MKRTVNLNNIFSEKYAQIIKKYVKRLNVLLKQYDAVIFMARKSICFYSALIIQGKLRKIQNAVLCQAGRWSTMY